MGTIVERQRQDGSAAYMAKIIIKREGKIVHRESKTFDRRAAARAWMEKRENELAKPGEIERAKAPPSRWQTPSTDTPPTAWRKSVGRRRRPGVFTSCIASGFCLLAGEVGFIASTLIAIDISLATLFWAWHADEDIIARLSRRRDSSASSPTRSPTGTASRASSSARSPARSDGLGHGLLG